MTSKSDEIAELAKRLERLERTHEKTLKRLAKAEAELVKRFRWTRKRLPELPTLAGLVGFSPDHAVVDVGFGPGHLTRELVTFLSPQGSYDGIEVQRELVEDMERRYGRLPNFHFHHADLENSTYNTVGAGAASGYRFPLEDGSADRVVLRSIVTHLEPPETDHYLAEISRVLKPGGRSYITWYLLDDESRATVRRGEGEPPHPLFQVDRGAHWVFTEERPLDAVAFEEQWIRDAYARHGMKILEPIHIGGWSVRPGRFDQHQDVVIAEKA